MTTLQDPNRNDLQVGQVLSGFVVERVLPLTDLGGVFYGLRHQATNARYIHISTADQENTFGVTLKTVPGDSTGVAHILEHTVLCGSRKYPVRDPFFSMLKRSLNTFMNAFTASDWTMYPFSTQNVKDFYNLMDVYLDAVFFPRLAEASFKQEGHRLEIAVDPDRPDQPRLEIRGVVYNEMKGAMSSADQVMARSLLNTLYPDTTYRHNSGGEPAQIPDLTHEQLRAFHQRHYHPSNAYFYTYGNLPLKEHLAFISEKILDHFTAIDPRTQVPAQPRWNTPRQARYTYALAAEEEPDRRYQACLAWLSCNINDTFEVLVLTVIEQILLGNAASPLRKALMDSGLGSSLSDSSGFDSDNRDTLFACGLKDVREDSAPAIERIITETLQQLVDRGLDRDMIESAIHQIEFHRREITNTPYPFGIKLLLRMIGTWLHGGQAERILQLDQEFERLRTQVAAGRFLEERIRTYFIDNPHRVLLILAPDREKSRLQEEHARRRLDDLWTKLTQQDKERLTVEAEALALQQEQHENIDCLPTLTLADIPGLVSSHEPDATQALPPLWCYHQPTSGILYFNAAAGAARVPRDLLPWVPFYCFAFSKTGTTRHDYVEMARRIDAATGGLGLGAQSRVLYRQPGSCLPLISLGAKCLNRHLTPMIGIVEELIAEIDFSNLERLKQLLGEYLSMLETAVIHNGHRLAVSLSARSFGPAGALHEMWNGLHQIRTLRSFQGGTAGGQLAQLADSLHTIAAAIFQPHNVVLAAVGETHGVAETRQLLSGSSMWTGFAGRQHPLDLQQLELKADPAPPFEGWSVSTAVSFVALTLATVAMDHSDGPVLAVLGKLLRSMYLHREIREKGGAYGAMALYSPENGHFSLASYRDPNIVRTLEVFEGVAAFVESGTFSDEDVKEAILQVCAEIDRPDPPGPAARKDFFRMIVGVGAQERQNYKQRVLAVSRQGIIETARRYLKPSLSGAGIAVISGREQLEDANAHMPQRPLELKTI